jgi:rhodanese-related sulfurtransferase
MERNELPENPPRWPFNEALEVSVIGTRDGVVDGSVVLVDIREPEELAVAAVPGALHIPMGELAQRVNEIDLGEDQTLALLCHTGRRSLAAAMALQRMGIDQARSVAGGIEWWSVRVDPSVPRY